MFRSRTPHVPETGGGVAQGVGAMSTADLQQLRNAMKKDPKAYTDELSLQVLASSKLMLANTLGSQRKHEHNARTHVHTPYSCVRAKLGVHK